MNPTTAPTAVSQQLDLLFLDHGQIFSAQNAFRIVRGGAVEEVLNQVELADLDHVEISARIFEQVWRPYSTWDFRAVGDSNRSSGLLISYCC